MAVDTSSYPKPQQTNFLDVVQKFQGIEQQKLGIDQSRLNLINNRYQILNKELMSLVSEPNLTPDKVLQTGQQMVTLGIIPSDMFADFAKTIPTDPTKILAWLQSIVTKNKETEAAINYNYGEKGYTQNNQTIQPVVTSNKPGFSINGQPPGSVQPSGVPIQMQQPPTTAIPDPDNPTAPPKFLGPQPYQPPILPNANMPVQNPDAPMQANPVKTVPIAPPQSQIKLPIQQAQAPNSPYGVPRGPVAGLGPGVAEAEVNAGAGAGTQLAEDRKLAGQFQRTAFPLMEAIPALARLGTKGTGPGTDTFNQVKSFILANVPGVKDNDLIFKDVKDFDKVKKYLTDFVYQNGNTGTNDKLAAAFAGSPSVGISNAAAQDVAKAALALARMKQAQVLNFEKTGLPATKYPQWLAQNSQRTDPRAFGVDMMEPKAKTKLFEYFQSAKTPTQIRERDLFERSLEMAQDAGFLTPK